MALWRGWSFYSPEELASIVKRSAGLLKVPTDEKGGFELARRSRGTPRIANRLLRRVRDYADVKGAGEITLDIAHRVADGANMYENGRFENVATGSPRRVR